eukprot:2755228-Rhodomonas_salina.2
MHDSALTLEASWGTTQHSGRNRRGEGIICGHSSQELDSRNFSSLWPGSVCSHTNQDISTRKNPEGGAWRTHANWDGGWDSQNHGRKSPPSALQIAKALRVLPHSPSLMELFNANSAEPTPSEKLLAAADRLSTDFRTSCHLLLGPSSQNLANHSGSTWAERAEFRTPQRRSALNAIDYSPTVPPPTPSELILLQQQRQEAPPFFHLP